MRNPKPTILTALIAALVVGCGSSQPVSPSPNCEPISQEWLDVLSTGLIHSNTTITGGYTYPIPADLQELGFLRLAAVKIEISGADPGEDIAVFALHDSGIFARSVEAYARAMTNWNAQENSGMANYMRTLFMSDARRTAEQCFN